MWRSRKTGGNEAIGPLIYGDVPLDQWGPPSAQEQPNEPWASFAQARQLAQAGQLAQAVAMWRQIAETDGLESRVTLQAWHFLRQAGQNPPEELGQQALGTVAEVPMKAKHDVLAAYRDGSARYLNHGGGAVIWDGEDPAIQAAIDNWLVAAQGLAYAIGAWDKPSLPVLPAGHLRVVMLTPGGHRFGQGPEAAIRSEAAVAQYLARATTLLQLLVDRAAPA